MDTQLLKNFIVLAKTKNFTNAAKQLYCSQSAISLQVVRLERLLGKSLFLRDKRNVVLTVEGEEFLGYAHQMLQIEDQMMQHFHKPSIKGEVRFGIPEDLATAYLSNILGSFMDAYPGIVLNVACEFTMDLLNGFNAQRYDFVLIKQDPQNPYLHSEQVWKEPLVWIGAKDKIHGYSKEEPLSLILGPLPCVYRERAIDALNREGMRWRIVYTSPSLTGTLAAVKAGLGVSVLPFNMVPKDLQVLQKLPVLKEAQIALLKQENASDATKVFASYVLDHIVANTKIL
jgi:DNA-binding transcriptional LysR family regulator